MPFPWNGKHGRPIVRRRKDGLLEDEFPNGVQLLFRVLSIWAEDLTQVYSFQNISV